MGQNTIIELNGKQYDAKTGALLGESRVKATPASRAGHIQHNGRVVDGFIKPGHTTQLAPKAVKPAPAKTVAAPTPVKAKAAGAVLDLRRVTPKPVKAHQPERAKTLMRHVVKKPHVDMKPSMKTTAPTEMMAKPASSLAKQLEKKLSVANVDPMRLSRSRQIARSHHVRRFNRAEALQNHRPAVHQATSAAIALQATQSQPAIAARTAPLARSTPAPRGNAQQEANDIFEAALAHATSHQELPHKSSGRRAKNRRRLVSITAGLAAFLVIGGFIAYVNKPGIELQVASIHAGFHAELPNYKPTGYALTGGIQSTEGKVAMTYSSGDSTYTITQEASDWDSATLLDQTTEQRGAPTQTVQSKGRIIYLYDNDITWVNGGVRYQINGNATLDSQELISLATSM